MPTWLAVLLSVFPVVVTVLMAILALAYKNGVKARDLQLTGIQSEVTNGFIRTDKALSKHAEEVKEGFGRNDKAMAELNERVRIQNGRVATMEPQVKRNAEDIQTLLPAVIEVTKRRRAK